MIITATYITFSSTCTVIARRGIAIDLTERALAPRDTLDLKLCDNFYDLTNVGWVLIL